MKTPIEYHKAATIFPLDEEHLDDLAGDIRKYGLKESIKLLDGKILDGRRRSLACEKAGVQVRCEEVQVADPIAYVISLNLHRRHLTASQLSMCAARATELRGKCELEAKERQKRKPTGSVPEKLPEQNSGDSRDKLGKVFGVSGRTVDHATKVLNNAVPEVIAAVDEGRMAVSEAAILSTEPEEVQRQQAAFKPNGDRRTRKYKANRNSSNDPPPQEPEEETNGEISVKGVGVTRAHEAINCLKRIPKNDALRKRGFQIVTDWIRHTLRE